MVIEKKRNLSFIFYACIDVYEDRVLEYQNDGILIEECLGLNYANVQEDIYKMIIGFDDKQHFFINFSYLNLKQLIEEGIIFKVEEYKLKTEDGRIIWCEIMIRIFKNQKDQHVYCSIQVHEIDDRKKLELSLPCKVARDDSGCYNIEGLLSMMDVMAKQEQAITNQILIALALENKTLSKQEEVSLLKEYFPEGILANAALGKYIIFGMSEEETGYLHQIQAVFTKLQEMSKEEHHLVGCAALVCGKSCNDEEGLYNYLLQAFEKAKKGVDQTIVVEQMDCLSPLSKCKEKVNEKEVQNPLFQLEEDCLSSFGVVSAHFSKPINGAVTQLWDKHFDRCWVQKNEFELLFYVCDHTKQYFYAKLDEAKKEVILTGFSVVFGSVFADKEIHTWNMIAEAEALQKLLVEQEKVEQKQYTKIQRKIKEGQYQMVLQPKLDLQKQKIKGAEALVRYISESGQEERPDCFLPKMEKDGTISCIDLFIFEEVCRLLHTWGASGYSLFPISFNISRRTLMKQDLLEVMEQIRKRYGIPKKLLEIEVTERMGALGKGAVLDAIENLRCSGYPIALDDFGVEYSNVSFLAEVNFHTVKLDRSLVQSIYSNSRLRMIVGSIIKICHEMNVEVVAEGVDRKEQQVILADMHCDLVQGYLLNKPLSSSMFEDIYMKEQRKDRLQLS